MHLLKPLTLSDQNQLNELQQRLQQQLEAVTVKIATELEGIENGFTPWIIPLKRYEGAAFNGAGTAARRSRTASNPTKPFKAVGA